MSATVSAKRSTKRDQRRDAIIAEASRQLNARGAGGLTLQSVGTALGVTRNALYYYFKSPLDLTFACYLTACRALEETFAEASTANGRRRGLRAIIECALSSEVASEAVLADVAILSEADVRILGQAQQRLLDSIAQFLSTALPRNERESKILALALLGMINWARLSSMWLGHAADDSWRLNAARAIVALIESGVAMGNHSADLPAALSIGVTPFAAEKEERILAATSWLFNRRGIDGTSLDDICIRLSATKGTLYHYFEDKNALVRQCYRRSFHIFEALVAAAEQQKGTGLTKVATLFWLNCTAQLSEAPPLTLQPGLSALDARDVARFVEQARELARRSEALLVEGQQDGSCRPDFNIQAVTEVSAGAFLWLPKWPTDWTWLHSPDLPREVTAAMTSDPQGTL